MPNHMSLYLSLTRTQSVVETPNVRTKSFVFWNKRIAVRQRPMWRNTISAAKHEWNEKKQLSSLPLFTWTYKTKRQSSCYLCSTTARAQVDAHDISSTPFAFETLAGIEIAATQEIHFEYTETDIRLQQPQQRQWWQKERIAKMCKQYFAKANIAVNKLVLNKYFNLIAST